MTNSDMSKHVIRVDIYEIVRHISLLTYTASLSNEVVNPIQLFLFLLLIKVVGPKKAILAI